MFDYEKGGTGLIDFIHSYEGAVIFGTGGYGRGIYYRLIRDIAGKICFFADNNPDLWGREIMDGIPCIAPSGLKKYRNLLCLILVSPKHRNAVESQLDELGCDYIYIDERAFHDKQVMEHYFGFRMPENNSMSRPGKMGEYDTEQPGHERVAVYTCIVNDFDPLKQPEVIEENCDYYFCGTEKPDNLGIYQWIDLSRTEAAGIEDPVRVNRYCKLHPHHLFPEHRYSIYVDGSILIKQKISDLVCRIGNVGIGVHELEHYCDLYANAVGIILSGLGGDQPDTVREQMRRYCEQGFPLRFGTSENGVLVREHHKQSCIDIMDVWWEEVLRYSRRDQLSLFYAVWKNGYKPEDLGSLGSNMRKTGRFQITRHRYEEAETEGAAV